jgi:hypothetical protein
MGVVQISVAHILDAVAGFDEFGGASPALVAWELCVSEEEVLPAWRRAVRDRLLRHAHDPDMTAQLWRLTGKGWAARGAAEGIPAA